ncbi:proline-rich protein 2-like, partial [Pollicipes pollicipes]|uniref:proline-rich protein 2-like n=1 Tax=Pollicipes pollicipes TaxID=41117 RepID=UPI001885767C
DGRVQHVKYVADNYGGYNAEVTYEGKAHAPAYKTAAPAYKPTYNHPAPAYKPVHKPVYSSPAPAHKPVHKSGYSHPAPAYKSCLLFFLRFNTVINTFIL